MAKSVCLPGQVPELHVSQKPALEVSVFCRGEASRRSSETSRGGATGSADPAAEAARLAEGERVAKQASEAAKQAEEERLAWEAAAAEAARLAKEERVAKQAA